MKQTVLITINTINKIYINTNMYDPTDGCDIPTDQILNLLMRFARIESRK